MVPAPTVSLPREVPLASVSLPWNRSRDVSAKIEAKHKMHTPFAAMVTRAVRWFPRNDSMQISLEGYSAKLPRAFTKTAVKKTEASLSYRQFLCGRYKKFLKIHDFETTIISVISAHLRYCVDRYFQLREEP